MDQKQEVLFPKVIHLRAERILAQKLKAVYKTQLENIAHCVTPTDQDLYIDLSTNKEVPVTQFKIEVENWGEVDTERLIGQPINIISPEAAKEIEEDQLIEEPKKVMKKGTTKTTSTKKKK